MRRLTEALQRGESSAPRALADARRWGEAAYRRPVDAWALDCAAGPLMNLPRGLTAPPALAISYAASHFRPRSSPHVQCAILVVSAIGTERVHGVSAGVPGGAPAPK